MTVQQAVTQGSTQIIIDAFQRLKVCYFSSGRWLGPRNRYSKDTVARVDHDFVHNNPQLSPQLPEYLAVSVLLHCFDGWSFLSQAAEGIIKNENKTAIHMGYYAELRAAMSFLAYSGIGVFNSKHCWVDASGGHFFKNESTHKFTWKALDEWANLPNKSTVLLNLISIRGSTIEDWLAAAGFSPASIPSMTLAQDWLKTWSLDLRLLASSSPKTRVDQHYRNEVSYRPQGVLIPSTISSPISNLSILTKFWQACEPAGNEQFSIIDHHLLRHALTKTFKIRFNKYPSEPQYKKYIDQMFANMGLSNSGSLYEFLMKGGDRYDHPILTEAKLKVKTTRSQVRLLPILARAMLLLRLSSASVESMLKTSRIDAQDFRFWWDYAGKQNGLWTESNAPEKMSDLWADVELAIENITGWCTENMHEHSLSRVLSDNGSDLWILKQFERAGLWGLGI